VQGDVAALKPVRAQNPTATRFKLLEGFPKIESNLASIGDFWAIRAPKAAEQQGSLSGL
jgi:hypothetical protein